MANPSNKNLIVFGSGSGGEFMRDYMFQRAGKRASLGLLEDEEVSWQRPYLHHGVVQPSWSDDGAATAAAASLPGVAGVHGVLAWNEERIAAAADAAEAFGVPGPPSGAVLASRDKWQVRQILEAAGVPSACARIADTLPKLRAAATELGYPVVLKPRGGMGSIGVSLITNEQDLDAALQHAHTASRDFDEAGLMVEEYLDGPEISVDSASYAGRTETLVVARKRLGFPPYFQEVGHLVMPWRHEPWAEDVVSAAAGAIAALGLDNCITHIEIRLTAAGPKIVEINARMGGDAIPLLGELATGLDEVTVAVDIALGRTPCFQESVSRCAEIAFLFSDRPGILTELSLEAAQQVPGLWAVGALQKLGTRVEPPPSFRHSRLAALIAVARTPEECAHALESATELVRYTVQ